MDIGPTEHAEKSKEAHFAETFESTWTGLPKLLRRVPFKQRWAYRKELTQNLPLRLKMAPWEKILSTVVTNRETSGTHQLNNSEARLAVMLENQLCYRILKDLGDITINEQGTWDTGKAAAFVTVMEAMKSTLPWNRTGINAITPDQVTMQTAREASAYIRQKLD